MMPALFLELRISSFGIDESTLPNSNGPYVLSSMPPTTAQLLVCNIELNSTRSGATCTIVLYVRSPQI